MEKLSGLVKFEIGHCLLHGRVAMFTQADGTTFHYDDIAREECYGMFVQSPPPEPLTEDEWEAVLATEGQLYEYP